MKKEKWNKRLWQRPSILAAAEMKDGSQSILVYPQPKPQVEDAPSRAEQHKAHSIRHSQAPQRLLLWATLCPEHTTSVSLRMRNTGNSLSDWCH